LQQRAQLVGDVEGLGGRLHRMSVADEQRVRKLRPEIAEHLADAGLGGRQKLRGPRDAALMQQGVQNPQLSQVQFR